MCFIVVVICCNIFFFKQKTAYELRISDWSSDVCSSDLFVIRPEHADNADDEEVYHLARKRFSLNGRAHELLLLRQLTSELRRQEVQTWKKVKIGRASCRERVWQYV